MTREKCLELACEATGGKRTTDYGTPEDNFSKIADLWTAYLNYDISTIDVAMMMALLKVARVKGAAHRPSDDCFVDLAGYAACACEINNAYEAHIEV